MDHDPAAEGALACLQANLERMDIAHLTSLAIGECQDETAACIVQENLKKTVEQRRLREIATTELDDMSLLVKGFPLLGMRLSNTTSDSSIGGTVEQCSHIPACITERMLRLTDFAGVLQKNNARRLRQMRSNMNYVNGKSVSKFVSLDPLT
eukprot:ANDGO_07035.mRNA.1 hypothetical protein